MIEGHFHSFVSAKAVGSSGNYSDFVVEALDGAIGDLTFGTKPIEDQRFMSAQHLGNLFHGFEAAAHGTEAPIVEKRTGPHHRVVGPKVGEGLF